MTGFCDPGKSNSIHSKNDSTKLWHCRLASQCTALNIAIFRMAKSYQFKRWARHLKGQNGYSVSFLQSKIAKRSTERSRRSLKSKMVSLSVTEPVDESQKGPHPRPPWRGDRSFGSLLPRVKLGVRAIHAFIQQYKITERVEAPGLPLKSSKSMSPTQPLCSKRSGFFSA